jgi:4-hydroxy-tetrahydrodipicolinate reductase
MGKRIKVAIAGINGRFGRTAARAILADNELELVGGFGRAGAPYVGQDIGTIVGTPNCGIEVSNAFLDLLDENPPDVILDFSKAEVAFDTARLAIERKVSPVVGTSGVEPQEVKLLASLAEKLKVGAMVVPNFSLGAVLMMEFAKQASQYFGDVEIVEMHNTGKADAPSGTAMHTAAKISAAGGKFNAAITNEKELLTGARGGQNASGVRVHSLRLPGLISHQEVIFGADGELLTIRHDGLNAECYMRGVLMSIKAVTKLDHLVVGLESLFNKSTVPVA